MILLCLVVFIIFMTMMTLAKTQEIPQPCIELAARENYPLPTNEAEAKSAKRKLLRWFVRRDPLAIACWRAINMELSK